MGIFLDEIILHLVAGKGGNGVVSFRREKYVPKGGPDGGDGGDGGSIYFKADNSVSTLGHLSFHRKIKAKDGDNGRGKNQTGKNGEDIYIPAPPGTSIYQDNILLADLCNVDDTFLAVKGGKGGKGNQHFATSVNQTPRKATPGKKGEEKNLKLSLKLIADIGLVGLPNAGKSTFLSVTTSANPKIASYPFTTIYPNLGSFSYDNIEYFIIADIPGLIEGASEGKGLGTRFLKHIERTKLLLFILDGEKIEFEEQLITLFNELNNFSSVLANKPFFVSISKIDIPLVQSEVQKFLSRLPIEILLPDNIKVMINEIMAFSSFNKEGISEILAKTSSFLIEQKKSQK